VEWQAEHLSLALSVRLSRAGNLFLSQAYRSGTAAFSHPRVECRAQLHIKRCEIKLSPLVKVSLMPFTCSFRGLRAHLDGSLFFVSLFPSRLRFDSRVVPIIVSKPEKRTSTPLRSVTRKRKHS
jgi:hypothetical protein